jgi:type 2A phosphatase activator TIP41
MTFGNNSLSLTYDPSTSYSRSFQSHQGNGEGSSCLRFDTLKALEGVAVGEGWEERVGGGVKVSMAESWGKSRSAYSVYMYSGHN